MLHRLAETLDAETQALGRNELERLGEASRMKSLGLLELNRSIVAARLFDGATLDAGARAQLSGLQEALERNLATLQLRLRAVRHVAAIIARAIEDHESDGTYTIGPAPGGGGR
ncbi:hypothetical protein [Methylocella sp.]|uniref:hypothetical protein n=1 Tax=Methylocella sp. TaxID=1978226 RepID=UPI0037838410